MRNSLLLLVALLGLSACTTAKPAAGDDRSKKEIYADELMAIVPPSIMFAQMSEPHVKGFGPPHLQAKAHQKFMSKVDVSEIDAIVRRALLKYFTEAELKAMVDFYTTPEGQSCMEKVGPFAAEVVPACASEATRAYRKAAVDAARGTLFQ
jgi:hypothetical protein